MRGVGLTRPSLRFPVEAVVLLTLGSSPVSCEGASSPPVPPSALAAASPAASADELDKAKAHVERTLSDLVPSTFPSTGLDPKVSIEHLTYEVQPTKDRTRLYAAHTDAGKQWLIRVLPPDSPVVSMTATEIAAAEAPSSRSWCRALARLTAARWEDPIVQHDALLEAAHRMEQALRDDPSHYGLMRDLLTTYTNLLVFEQETQLGSSICLVSSALLEKFERAVAPPDGPDRELMRRTRVWLYYVMELYPLAAVELAASGIDPMTETLRITLEELGQDSFRAKESFKAADLEVRVFQAEGVPPDEAFPWGHTYFIVSPAANAPPASSVAFVLVRSRGRHEIHFRSLNRARMLRTLGREEPKLEDLKRFVIGTLVASRSGDTPEED